MGIDSLIRNHRGVLKLTWVVLVHKNGVYRYWLGISNLLVIQSFNVIATKDVKYETPDAKDPEYEIPVADEAKYETPFTKGAEYATPSANDTVTKHLSLMILSMTLLNLGTTHLLHNLTHSSQHMKGSIPAVQLEDPDEEDFFELEDSDDDFYV
eukprot:m.322916 g.322916  ORF g.322916 m.322916 type:complete len:154 (-) comp16535_c0_seq38:66-527(-)